ncbi:hypothetical protein [Nitratireductor sp.]|uniref:hypothetical protein n=1 Tax=Nitratireductor sp. TaxID=1872084 RepID=UPI00261CAF68|nr:hypothetical protein [Nitratireductor sp.]MCV0381770.1 hypothetical protein [Nitratireductor sp.]
MAQDFDLFGNPLVTTEKKLGRPEHEPDEEKIIFVMVLLASGATNREVAKTLGLSVPTFRKHYLHLIKHRDLLLDRLQTKLRVSQIRQGLSGNASALNAALGMLERVKAESADRTVKARGTEPAKKPEKLGKKEQQKMAAQNVGGKYATPVPPKLVIDNR